MNNKGLLALESLVGIILSVVALIFLIQVFFSAFLQTPENQKVAEDNVNSIVDFVEISDFGDGNLCYNILRMDNIENFQSDSEKNYFYVIDKESVYMYDESTIKIFLEGGNIYSRYRPKHKVDFERNIEIKKDVTDSGSIISLWGILGKKDSKIQLESTEAILILPVYGDAQSYYEIYSFSDGEWDSDTSGFFRNNVDGGYLIFSSENNLFFSNSENSDYIAKSKLCSTSILITENNEEGSQ